MNKTRLFTLSTGFIYYERNANGFESYYYTRDRTIASSESGTVG